MKREVVTPEGSTLVDLTAEEIADLQPSLAVLKERSVKAIAARADTVLAAGAPVAGGLHIAIDDGSRADLTAMATTAIAAIRTRVGEDHYVETLSRALSLGDGGANDLADIANNIWPRSLRSDSIHPTKPAWGSVIGFQLVAKLTARGW